MKVLVIMPSGIYRGGAEEALLHLAKARHSAGVEMAVVFLEDGNLVARVAAEGVRAEVFDAGRFRDIGRFIATVTMIRRIIKEERPDLVLGWMTKGHLYGGVAAWLSGIPAAYYQMGLPDGGSVDRLARWVPAAGAIGCSEFVASEQRRVVKHPVIGVCLAADMERFEKVRGKPGLKEQLGFDPDRPLVGMVGRLQRWKGMHFFADAMAQVFHQVPECQAVIVGGMHDLESDYPDALAAHIASLGLTDRIRMAGTQSNIPEWMQAMDVIVHASEREPFGIVVVEAMSLGKPVIASKPGGPEEIIRDGMDGQLVAWSDSQGLSAAILRFLTDANFAHACGESALKRSEEFTLAKFADRLCAAMGRLVNKAAR